MKKRELLGYILLNKEMKRLAAYEKTGLTPEQIVEMDKMYLEKCEEVNRLKERSTCMNCSNKCY